MERLGRDEMMMRVAAVVSQRGTCQRASVGAVIVLDGRIVSTGYVGSPAGMPHCTDVGCELGDDQGCVRTVHAESNAIAFAARAGIATDRSTLYCTHSPCLNCAKIILNAGIVRLVYEEPYRITEGLKLLEDTILVNQWS
jgi:dCMP deaminase